MPSLPAALEGVLMPFAPLFRRPVWRRAQVLLIGALLSPGRRTVTQALRVVGLGGERRFPSYHRVLSRATWSCREASRVLLVSLVRTFAPEGPLVFGLDDTIERRWGRKIKARGIYRDPVRSSHGHFVKASGLRWLSLALLAPVPWAGRVWALPVLTVLCPSERYARLSGRRHKTLLDWARQMVLQLRRWLPERELIVVGDNAYAALEWLGRVREQVTAITRLRLDARLYEPAPPRKPGTRGRPRKKGERLPALEEVLTDPRTCWRRVRLSEWYGRGEREMEITTGTAVWFHGGMPVVPLRSRAGSRSAGGARSESVPLHESGVGGPHRSALLRAALADRGHLRGDAASSRDGEPAPVVRSRDCPHHALPAGPLLGGHARGRSSPPAGPAQRAAERLV